MEEVVWQDDGTPRSPRFDDVYRTTAGGLAQARHVFLQGCGLPAAWAGQPQWRILETGFGLGLNFLAAWQAWRADPARPGLLHFVSIEAWPVTAADLRRSVVAWPQLQPLAEALAEQWVGLLPGVHRLSFDGGRVLLTLAIGEVQPMLRQLALQADSIFLDGFDPQRNPQMWELATLKGLARLARQGAGIATWSVQGQLRRDLKACGFVVEKAPGLPPKRERLQGRYAPHWQPRHARPRPGPAPGTAVVVGAGLAGAAAAASLARRGWQVRVLDAAAGPAEGASGLPAGLLAPQQSPDDNPLSRLSRSGVRMTLQQLRALLAPGADWEPAGVLEWRGDDPRTPPLLGPQLAPWTRVADAGQLREAGLAPQAHAWWHEQAAWVRPSALVRAWLAQPGITFQGQAAVATIRRQGDAWVLRDAGGQALARAELVVLAAAYATAGLLRDGLQEDAAPGPGGAESAAAGARPPGRELPLNPVRGQLAWQRLSPGLPLPPWPMNGHGHLIPRVPLASGRAWVSGATYGRGETATDIRPADQDANLARLARLQPQLAAALAPLFASGAVEAWAGVRCTSFDRRPLVGEWAPGLWVSTALGSRGLSFAALCGELLAARLHGEPLPLEPRLAAMLDLARIR